MMLIFVFLSLLVNCEAAKDVSWKILRVTPNRTIDVHAIKDIKLKLGFEPIFLMEARAVRKPADIVVDPKNLPRVVQYFKQNNISYRSIENKKPKSESMRRVRSQDGKIQFKDVQNHYLSFEDQILFVDQLVAGFPKFVKSEVIGKSYEGRQTKSITFGYPSRNPKPLLYVTCGIHAREWIGSAVCMNYMWKLAHESEWSTLLNKIDILIVPNVNPDGYEFSRLGIYDEQTENQTGTANSRLWRKTRSGPYPDWAGHATSCLGVDPNRNFPYKWNFIPYLDNDPCDDAYKGLSAQSEVEVQNLVKDMLAKKDRMKAYIDLHSYGDVILYPWGYSSEAPMNADTRKTLESGAAMWVQAINAATGVKYDNYQVPKMYEGMPVAGTSIDFAFSLGISYVYTIELGQGVNYEGFVAPASEIPLHSAGMFAGLVAQAKQIIKEETVATAVKPQKINHPKNLWNQEPAILRKVEGVVF